MTYRENFASCISLYYYNMIYENLFESYQNLAVKDNRNKINNIL